MSVIALVVSTYALILRMLSLFGRMCAMVVVVGRGGVRRAVGVVVVDVDVGYTA